MHFVTVISQTALLLISCHIVVSNELDSRQNGQEVNHMTLKQTHNKAKTKPVVVPRRNISYLDVSQNMRMPYDMEQVDLEQYAKKKKRKSPKRTIQKIIKSGKMKNRKSLGHVTIATAKATMDSGRNIQNDDNLSQRVDTPSTMASIRKRSKKRYGKASRNPMPLHKFQSRRQMNNQRRAKRKISDDNAFIIQDLDEVQFIGNNNEYDTINAHIKSYW